MKIDHRYDKCNEEFYQTPAKVGMVIAEKIDYQGKYREPRTFPHYDFSYVIFKVLPDGVEVRDTGHNNLWTFNEEELKGYELVRDWHPNVKDEVGDFVNDALED